MLNVYCLYPVSLSVESIKYKYDIIDWFDCIGSMLKMSCKNLLKQKTEKNSSDKI